MTTAPSPATDADAASSATEVARGVCRFLYQAGVAPLCEVPLGSGRRADVFGLDATGGIILVEIKVSLADLRGDMKWLEYLDYCDRFYWAAPAGFALAEFAQPVYLPDRTGLLIADRFGAAVVREATIERTSAARRKAETLRFARRAAERLLRSGDPFFAEGS